MYVIVLNSTPYQISIYGKRDQIHSFHMVILVNIIIQKKDFFS